MSLILAVQPDRKQAAKIVAIARGSLGAQIVVTESAEEALASIAKTVPDLVLISQFLSPKDDQAITDRLRQLDTAGASVPTLVIPMFGSASRRSPLKQTGLLGRLRKTRGSVAAPDGCDPDVFAAQITEYLERAAAERQLAQADRAAAPNDFEPLARATGEIGPAAPAMSVRPVRPAVVDPPISDLMAALDQLAAPMGAIDAAEGVEEAVSVDAFVAEAPDAIFVPASMPVVGYVEPSIDIEPFVAEAIAAHDEPQRPPERPIAYELERSVDLEPFVIDSTPEEAASELEPSTVPVNQVDWEEIDLDSPDSDLFVLTAGAIDLDAFIRELEGFDSTPPRFEAPKSTPFAVARTIQAPEPTVWGLCAWPHLEGESVAEPQMEMERDFEIAADPELAEFAAALEELSESPDDPAEELWMPLTVQPDYVWPRMESAVVRAHTVAPNGSKKALQDQWGFFDPEQCGISAVLKRLSLIDAQDSR